MSRKASSSTSSSLKMRTVLIGSPMYAKRPNRTVLTRLPSRSSSVGMTRGRSIGQTLAKFASSCMPNRWLFSGWNWAPKMLPASQRGVEGHAVVARRAPRPPVGRPSRSTSARSRSATPREAGRSARWTASASTAFQPMWGTLRPLAPGKRCVAASDPAEAGQAALLAAPRDELHAQADAQRRARARAATLRSRTSRRPAAAISRMAASKLPTPGSSSFVGMGDLAGSPVMVELTPIRRSMFLIGAEVPHPVVDDRDQVHQSRAGKQYFR